MKCKTINVTLTVNLGNYESLRIGGEWELEPGETEGRQIVKTYEALKKTGYTGTGTHYFLRKEVELIVRYLGEP